MNLDPLPSCKHGSPVLDGSGEHLEPPCGCRWNNNSPVPMKDWDRDHWSTFAYAMARVAGLGGKLDREQMRCDPRRYPGLAHRGSMGEPSPTRLSGDRTLMHHDDWDCLDDAVEAGLLTYVGTGINPGIAGQTPKGLFYAQRIWDAERAGKPWSRVNEGMNGTEWEKR